MLVCVGEGGHKAQRDLCVHQDGEGGGAAFLPESGNALSRSH